MNFDVKVEEFRSYYRKWIKDVKKGSIDIQVQALQIFFSKWIEELRSDMGIHKPGSSIGVSFMEEFKIPRLPQCAPIELGIYEARDSEMKVEVVLHPSPDIVVFEVMDSTGYKLATETMSPGIFTRMFRKAKHPNMTSTFG